MALLSPYPVKIKFTPAEKEALLSRLGRGMIPEASAERYARRDGNFAEDYAAIKENVGEVETRLADELRKTGSLVVTDEEDEAVVVDALEGSTFWNHYKLEFEGLECEERRNLYVRLRQKLKMHLDREIGHCEEFAELEAH